MAFTVIRVKLTDQPANCARCRAVYEGPVNSTHECDRDPSGSDTNDSWFRTEPQTDENGAKKK